MHCPSCGQQQVSNDTKFCSRCGMPLGIVSELLMHGGYLPQLALLDQTHKTVWTRKNGIAFSVFWFIFFVPLLTSVFGGVFGVEILGELLALIGVFGSILIFLFSLIYLKPAPPMRPIDFHTAPNVPGHLLGSSHGILPPSQSVPANVHTAPGTGAWRDTNDLQPASVTENTTRLLTKDDADQ